MNGEEGIERERERDEQPGSQSAEIGRDRVRRVIEISQTISSSLFPIYTFDQILGQPDCN